MELLLQYGLFLAKTVTIVGALIVILVVAVNAVQRRQELKGHLQLTDLSEQYREMQDEMRLNRMKPVEQKLWFKSKKKEEKQKNKAAKQSAKQGDDKPEQKSALYVIDFKGSMDAHEVNSLREEISAILAVAKQGDEVLLKLESPGGVVHGYGLAASQLQRLRQTGIRLTAVVDKVAASGGYMMACVADRIVAAPFAIIGSVGVVAQVPNFNRLLKRNNVDIELHTAGEYKRTLTMFGENTEQGREKFREDLNQTHVLFKQFVNQMRPSLNIDEVATGEHWFGTDALNKGLIDMLGTSDDLLIAEMEKFEVIGVRYMQRKKVLERFTKSAASALERLLINIWQKGEKPLL